MTAEAFSRIYPAAGAQVAPVTYSAVGRMYAMVCVPFGIFAFMLLVLASLAGGDPTTLLFVVPFLVVIVAGVLGVRRMRLEIRSDGISYTGWVGAPRFIAFSELSTAVVHYAGRDRITGGPRRIQLTMTPNPSAGKRAIKLQLRAFPPAANEEIARLLDPEVTYGRF